MKTEYNYALVEMDKLVICEMAYFCDTIFDHTGGNLSGTIHPDIGKHYCYHKGVHTNDDKCDTFTASCEHWPVKTTCIEVKDSQIQTWQQMLEMFNETKFTR